jgi:hypothetical protein
MAVWMFLFLVCSLWNMVDAQERPSLQAAKFSSSQGFRTNVCDRQFEVTMGNRSLRDGLIDMKLTVAITNYQVPSEDQLFSLDKTTGGIKKDDPGLFVVLMDELARRAGFSWRESYAAIDPLSSVDGNKTWTDLLKWEIDHFDIAVDYWARSYPRMALGICECI